MFSKEPIPAITSIQILLYPAISLLIYSEGLTRLKLLAASLSKPSTVLIVPFCVAAGISKSSSGILIVALSDFTT